MKIEEFVEDPFGKKAIHQAYSSSCLHMRPAPEYASGEVVLASLLRSLGLGKSMEGNVPANGRQLLQRISRKKHVAGGIGFAVDTWQGVLESSLRSPKQPNQSAKRFLQLCPLVPDCCIYSSSARLSTNSWNPGQMVERMIALGSPSPESAAGLWTRLFECLSVQEDEDDPWATALQREFIAWRTPGTTWSLQSYEHSGAAAAWRAGGGSSPSIRFVADLDRLLGLKRQLTRRQWVSMLESLLRLATASHVLWLCKANRECLNLFRRSLAGDSVPPHEKIADELVGVGPQGFWRYGQRAAETVRDVAREFVMARTGLNLMFFMLEELGILSELGLADGVLASPAAIHQAASKLSAGRSAFPLDEFEESLRRVMDKEPRLTAAKKGIGANIAEFLRHVLGQRQTSEEGMRSYDQGFWLRKRGFHNSSPWIVSAGPVAVLSAIYCCCVSKVGPATVDDLCAHLREYGISVKSNEVPGGDLGRTLRNMGLVTDSPDAEGGMLIRNPFEFEGGESK